MEEDENVRKFNKLLHKKSPTFISEHATGVALSGPSNDGSFHFLFYADSINIKSETTNRIQSTEINKNIEHYNLTIELDDVEDFREDKARISLPYNVLISLRDLINSRLSELEKIVTNNEQKE